MHMLQYNNNNFKWIMVKVWKSMKRRILVLVCLICAFYTLLKWRLMCVNVQPMLYLKETCSNFETGKSIGSLCEDLCLHNEITSLTCHTLYMEKDSVFSGIWRNNSVVFKTVKQHLYDIKNVSEGDFSILIKNNIKLKFNMSIDIVDAKRMSFIQYNQKGLRRNMEKQNAWCLLQNNEYLALSLYEKYDIFPKLYGSCGTMYAVQKLNSISGYWHLMTVYDSQDEWERRIKIALMILDFIQLLEERLPEPLHLCDIKMNNFGVTDDFKKVMYLDLDSVHPFSVASAITANGAECKKHSDCDLLDCRSFCNLITFKCQHGVVNNNLQMICERIFLGWVLSGRVMVPGLLLGPRTPRVLTELLEVCANPGYDDGVPRAPAKKDIRSRLYSLLSHLIVS